MSRKKNHVFLEKKSLFFCVRVSLGLYTIFSLYGMACTIDYSCICADPGKDDMVLGEIPTIECSLRGRNVLLILN